MPPSGRSSLERWAMAQAPICTHHIPPRVEEGGRLEHGCQQETSWASEVGKQGQELGSAPAQDWSCRCAVNEQVGMASPGSNSLGLGKDTSSTITVKV